MARREKIMFSGAGPEKPEGVTEDEASAEPEGEPSEKPGGEAPEAEARATRWPGGRSDEAAREGRGARRRPEPPARIDGAREKRTTCAPAAGDGSGL